MYRFLLFLSLSLCLCPVGRAGGWQLNLLSQRNMAMGLAGTALIWGPEAAFFNPGALSFTPHRANLYFGTSASWPSTQYLAQWPSIYQAETLPLLQTPVNLYANWRPRSGKAMSRFSLGLSVNNPFASSIRWPLDWKGRFISQEFDLNTFFFQPTVSYRLTEHIGIGVGLVYGFGTLSLLRGLQVDGQNGSESSVRLSGTGGGFGANVGILMKAGEEMVLGLNFRSGLRIHMKDGLTRFQVPESLRERYPDTSFEGELPLPWSLNAGIRLKPEERLFLTLQLDYTAWQVVDSLKLGLAEPVEELELYQKRVFLRGMAFRIGGEYLFNEWLKIRAGGYYDASPVPQGYVSPEFPDANRIGLTTGLGINLGKSLQLDVSYGFDFTGERTAVFEPAVFSGTYESTTSYLGLGLMVKLGKQK